MRTLLVPKLALAALTMAAALGAPVSSVSAQNVKETFTAFAINMNSGPKTATVGRPACSMNVSSSIVSNCCAPGKRAPSIIRIRGSASTIATAWRASSAPFVGGGTAVVGAGGTAPKA